MSLAYHMQQQKFSWSIQGIACVTFSENTIYKVSHITRNKFLQDDWLPCYIIISTCSRFVWRQKIYSDSIEAEYVRYISLWNTGGIWDIYICANLNPIIKFSIAATRSNENHPNNQRNNRRLRNENGVSSNKVIRRAWKIRFSGTRKSMLLKVGLGERCAPRNFVLLVTSGGTHVRVIVYLAVYQMK